MTINELYKLCSTQIAKGKGDKYIYISSDDEGNDRHELFYWFTYVDEGYVDDYRLQDMGNHHWGKKNCILLW